MPVFLAAWIAVCSGAVFADTCGPPVTLVGDCYHMYSPFQVGDRIWLGGWMEEPQQVPWPDKIYVSQRNLDGRWTIPTPIQWADSQSYPEAGAIEGFHINDPVILPDVDGGRWIMLYTAFPNDAINPEACDPEVNPRDCLELERHAVGWLASRDAGATWEDQGILLTSPEGVWSPGAVEMKDELWVYYIDAVLGSPPEVWRQRLDKRSMQPIAARERVTHPGAGLTNVDVRRDGDRILLAGNRIQDSEVSVYTSNDGLDFHSSTCWPDPVLACPWVALDGPHLAATAPLRILTGYNEGEGSRRIVSFQPEVDTAVCNNPPVAGLLAAVLPSGRAVQIGSPASAFATIISSGITQATHCGLYPLPIAGTDFVYQTTDPATNALAGTPNTPVDIAAGGSQSYVFAFTPRAEIAPTEALLAFDCSNMDRAPVVPGLNTFLLSSSATPVPDIVVLSATPSADGIFNLADTGAFAVATVNVGSGDIIMVSADTGSASLPVSIALCETKPTDGTCVDPKVPSVGPITTFIAAHATPTFSCFVTSTDAVPFDPANNRIFVRFKDAGGATRGITSVAARTVEPFR